MEGKQKEKADSRGNQTKNQEEGENQEEEEDGDLEEIPEKNFQEWKELYGKYNSKITTVGEWMKIHMKCKCVEEDTPCQLFPAGSGGTYGHLFHWGFD